MYLFIIKKNTTQAVALYLLHPKIYNTIPTIDCYSMTTKDCLVVITWRKVLHGFTIKSISSRDCAAYSGYSESWDLVQLC